MTDLDALLEGIVADPANALRWLVMADWLEENGQPERAELVRVHRELLRTCTATRETKARKQLHARMMELMRAGVQPCLPQRTITLPGGVEMRFSFIPPGSFLMGSPESEEERVEDETLHLVTLTRGFWLGQTPVTQTQWVAVIGENPSHFKGEELPVEQVSWDDAQACCAAVRELMGVEVRLPTEAEWEYACRSGTTTPFHWGAEFDGTQANCAVFGGPLRESTAPVGRYATVVPHPWRLLDMVGNIAEWCADCWQFAFREDAVDPLYSSEDEQRVVRGGGWFCDSVCCRSASRTPTMVGVRLHEVGFRLAADLSALA